MTSWEKGQKRKQRVFQSKKGYFYFMLNGRAYVFLLSIGRFDISWTRGD